MRNDDLFAYQKQIASVLKKNAARGTVKGEDPAIDALYAVGGFYCDKRTGVHLSFTRDQIGILRCWNLTTAELDDSYTDRAAAAWTRAVYRHKLPLAWASTIPRAAHARVWLLFADTDWKPVALGSLTADLARMGLRPAAQVLEAIERDP